MSDYVVSSVPKDADSWFLTRTTRLVFGIMETLEGCPWGLID
jgi:hypothetical protein